MEAYRVGSAEGRAHESLLSKRGSKNADLTLLALSRVPAPAAICLIGKPLYRNFAELLEAEQANDGERINRLETGVKHYLLSYEVADDYLARRATYRAEHLAKAWKASQRGELLLAGALADPIDGAVLLFKGESRSVAEDFARADPYVASGLVKRWHVREWTTVVGDEAATPVHPPA